MLRFQLTSVQPIATTLLWFLLTQPVLAGTVQYELAVSKTGTGFGNVASSPAGIACGSTCTATFDAGTVVILTATHAPGSFHIGWEGEGCDGGATCRVTMDRIRNVTALFVINNYPLSINKVGTGNGWVTSLPEGVVCGESSCSGLFDYQTQVTLTATGDLVSNFMGWSGQGCSGTGTCSVLMNQARGLNATFDHKPCEADAYESNNSCAESTLARSSQAHTLCDEDWVAFVPIAGATYNLETSGLYGGADTTLALFANCGDQLAFDDNGGGGLASRIQWTADSAEPLQLQVRNVGDNYGLFKGYRIAMICISGCDVFADGFESGTTFRWSQTIP